jgi:hypothetical protein
VYVATFGLAHQMPSLGPFTLAPFYGGLQEAVQTSQGAQIGLPLGLTATVTGFLQNYLGLTDATVTCPAASFKSLGADPCVGERVRGRTYGIEVLVRRAITKRVTGWIAYTLSRSTREAHLPGDAQALEVVPSEYDRTHVLNVIAAYDFGRRWRAGARFFYYSGNPYTRMIAGIEPVPPFNRDRLPDFYRIDVRLEKAWRVSESGTIAVVLEAFNATLRKEAVGVFCDFGPGIGLSRQSQPQNCQVHEVGPLAMPSLGVEGRF